jgi:hypothetical protein
LLTFATLTVLAQDGSQQAGVAAALRSNVVLGKFPGANTGSTNSTIEDYAPKNLNGDLAKILNHTVAHDEQSTNFVLGLWHSTG